MASQRKKAADINSQWEMIKSQRSTWLFPMFTALIIVVTVGLVLAPQITQILEMREEIRTEAERLERLVQKRTFLEQLPEAEIEEQVLLATRALPNGKPIYEVIEAFGSELNELGVTLKSYEIAPGQISSESGEVTGSTENQPGMLSALVLSFQATGSRESLLQLLTRINLLSPLTGLRQLELEDDALALLPLFEFEDGFGMIENMGVKLDEDDEVQIGGDLVMYYALPPLMAGKVSDQLPRKGVMDEAVVSRVRALEAYRKQMVEVPMDIDNNRENLFNF
jgi:hypothetical protein